jgi:CheY-like chemotaxis protein
MPEPSGVAQVVCPQALARLRGPSYHQSNGSNGVDMSQDAPSVLCVDDDREVAEVVEAILTDEGYRVSCLYELADNALLRAVGRLEPDVILLDSASAVDYDEAWRLAASIHERSRPVAVVMFTAHQQAADEAAAGASRRAGEAQFAAIVRKPFEIDDLIATVADAAGHSDSFDRSRAADAARTKALVAALETRGATEVRPSKMREWALFRDRKGRLLQVYWWQARGVYQVGRYRESGQMVMLGQFVDRDAAIEVALPS